MAAPKSVSMKDLSGRWIIHTKLSDDFDPLLALQGVAWWKRQAATVVTLTEHVRQYIGEDKVHRIQIEQKMTGGFKGGEDVHVLDGIERSSESVIYGTFNECSEWSDLSNVDDEWLKEGWLHNRSEEAGPHGEMHIKIIGTHSTLGWTTTVIWGFVELNGQRYHARKAVCKKGDIEERARGVYSWVD